MDDHNYRGHGGRRQRNQHHGERRPVPLSELDPAITEVSRKSIGCAIEVHMSLGPGYPREVYLTALEQELVAQGIGVERDKVFSVTYKDQSVGEVTADLCVDGLFLLMVMARPGEVGAERSLLRARLRAADMELGLIMNFGERRMTDGLVRVLNPDKLNARRGDEHEDSDHDDHEDAHETDDAPMGAPPELQD
ncbi:MAG: GxxExxY protein [Planctomycetota bacterium]